ncbi:hypothetical protein LOK49_LG07G01654 [Camellia lanceoleosa]|uniref:Uncharacterized protein n=1 Tax=Camellia lanceoleosa TaxID=1840588 RepID=A0ACC0HB60_9ERIC|nr:hypothetical protein LOK49_LG07G01654 [Camellia lanceoleosa]
MCFSYGGGLVWIKFAGLYQRKFDMRLCVEASGWCICSFVTSWCPFGLLQYCAMCSDGGLNGDVRIKEVCYDAARFQSRKSATAMLLVCCFYAAAGLLCCWRLILVECVSG